MAKVILFPTETPGDKIVSSQGHVTVNVVLVTEYVSREICGKMNAYRA